MTQVYAKHLCSTSPNGKFKYLNAELWCPLGNNPASLWLEFEGGQPRYFAYLNAGLHDWARVGELIRRTMSDILNRAEIHDPDLNRMSITVGEVSCSPDLKVATVYVMPLMGSVSVDEAIAALARNKHELRRRLGAEMTLRLGLFRKGTGENSG